MLDAYFEKAASAGYTNGLISKYISTNENTTFINGVKGVIDQYDIIVK